MEYQTSATLMPEVQSTQSSAGSLLQQYGGLLGMSGSINLSEEGSLPPQIYPEIVQSMPFQLELLNQEVQFSAFDTTATVYTFFDEIYTPSIFSYILEYSIGLPGKIMNAISGEELAKNPLPKGFESDSVISVTKRQMKIIENLRERVTVSMSEETGLITLLVEMPDANAAAQVGKTSISLIKEYVTNYRVKKARQNLEFVQEQMQQARQQFLNAQQKLAEFRDSNINLTTSTAQSKEQRLQSEYDLAFNVYNSLAQQVEQAKLKVQEETPVVSILQPVQVPVEESSPRRLLILIVSGFLGVVISAVIITVKRFKLE